MANKKHTLNFKLVDTIEEAEKLSESIYSGYNQYLRQKYGKPKYHPWVSGDGREAKIIVWYRN